MTTEKWFGLTAPMELLSSLCASLLSGKDINNACPAKSDEQQKLANSRHFGDNWKTATVKPGSRLSLEVWEPHIQKLVRVGLTDAMQQTWTLAIEYDEVWERKHTKYLSSQDVKKHWNDLDITRLYWLEGTVQAAVVLKKYGSNPISHEKFARPEYKIIDLLSREEILASAMQESHQQHAHHKAASRKEAEIIPSPASAPQ
jgi:hypothetical protein